MPTYAFPKSVHTDADNLPGQTFAWSQLYVGIDLTGYTATMTIDGIAVNLPCTVSPVQTGANTASLITLTSVLGATTNTWLPGVYAYRVTLTAPDATTNVAAYGNLLELTPRKGTVYGTVGPQGPQGLQGPSGAAGAGFVPGGDIRGTASNQIVNSFIGVPLDATVATPSDQYVISYDATSGKYTPKPVFVYNPRNYGAVYDTTVAYSSTFAKQNTIALNRMIAAIKNTPFGSHMIEIDGPLSTIDTFQIDCPVTFRTIGGGGGVYEGPSAIKPPADVEAIRLCPGGAYGSRVSELALTAASCHVPPLWLPNTAYSRNAIVRYPGSNKYVLRCVIAGTSGAAIPATFSNPDAITPRRWSPGMQCAVGDYLFPSRASGLYGVRMLQVTSAHGSTTAGTVGSLSEVSEPAYDSATAGSTWTSGDLVLTVVDFATVDPALVPIWNIPDNTAKWIAEPISGIVCHASANIDRLTVSGFSCLAVEVYSQSSAPALANGDCSGTHISRIYVRNGGAGIYVAGTESNGVTVSDSFVYQVGVDPATNQQMPGRGGVGYEDNSQVGTVWRSCLAETTIGPTYISSPSGSSIYEHCYTDGSYLPSRYGNYAIRIGGVDVGPSVDSTVVTIGPNNNGGILNPNSPADRFGSYPLFANTITNNGKDVYAISSDRDRHGADYTAYHADSFYQGVWFRANQIGAAATFRYLTGFTTNRSPLGRGNEWNIPGQFRGLGAYWEGYDSTTATDGAVRFAKRNVGDTWVANTTPTPGQFRKKITTTAGSIGATTWSTSKTVISYDPETAVPPTTLLGGDGYQYTCVKSGVTDPATQPTWSASTAIGPSARAWTPNTRVWPGDLVRPTNDSLFYFKVSSPPFWSANTNIKCGSLISPTTTNGQAYDTFRCEPPSYLAGAYVMVGDIYQPTLAKRDAATRLAQVLTGIVDRGHASTDPGAQGIGGTEPSSWPTTDGSTTTIIYFGDPNYQTTWRTTQLTTGATEPTPWSHLIQCQVDGGAEYSGGIIGRPDGNLIWTSCQLISGSTEPAAWDHSTVGATTTDTGGTSSSQAFTVPFTYSYVAVIPTGALLPDGTARWMRTDTVPVYASTEQVIVPGTLTKTGAGTVSLSLYEAHYQGIKTTLATTLAFGTNHYDGNVYYVTNANSVPLAVTPGTTSIPAGSTYALKSDGTNLNVVSVAPAAVTIVPALPQSLSGLTVWLRSDIGVTQSGTVSQWNDQSGNANHFAQAAAGQRPAFNAQDLSFNGRPSLSFTGGSSNTLVSPSMTIGPFTRFLVLRQTTSLYMLSFGLNDLIYGDTPGGLWINRGGATSSYNVGAAWAISSAPRVLVHRFDGTHAGHWLYINGVQQTLATYSTFNGDPGTSTFAHTMSLFADAAGSSYGSGSIAEFIVYNRGMSNAEIQRVNAYLQTLYMAY